MEKLFFDDEFDFLDYIRERFDEAGGLDNRNELQNTLEQILVPFYENVNKSYKNLESKINESKQSGSHTVITGVTRKEKFDVSNTSLVPMCQEDTVEEVLLVKEMVESIEKQIPFFCRRILINADHRTISRIKEKSKIYHGYITSERGQYPIEVQIKPVTKYQKEIEQLYTDFLKNGIRWNTVFSPYLYKMFDVFIVSAEYPLGETIQQIEIDFEEMNTLVEYDCIPIWNIQTKVCKTSAFPDFCKDRIHYLHTLYGSAIAEGKDYLVCGDTQIWNVSKVKDELQIQCSESEPVNWTIKEFSYDMKEMDKKYRLFHNVGNMTFPPIHTKAQLKYVVEKFDYDNLLSLEDVRVLDTVNEIHTYGLNEFIVDEIRDESKKQYLKFDFQSKEASNPVLLDYMSYVVSCVASVYPEFKCVGYLLDR